MVSRLCLGAPATATAKARTTPEMMIMRLFVLLATLLTDTLCQHQRAASAVVKDGEFRRLYPPTQTACDPIMASSIPRTPFV